MAELKISNEEKLNKFMQDNNIDTLNFKAIALMFMKQQDQIEEMQKIILNKAKKFTEEQENLKNIPVWTWKYA